MRRDGKPNAAASPRRPTRSTTRPQLALRAVVVAALLVSVGQAVAISQDVLATLGDTSNTLYQTSLHQLQVTTFLRVSVAAVAFWLVLLGRRAGYVLATILGVVTLLLYVVSITTPADPGPQLAPVWLHAVGLLAAGVMTLGGALGIRGRTRG